MQQHLNIRIKLTHPNARVPTYGSEGAACFDLYAAIDAAMDKEARND